MIVKGACHCGNLAFELDWTPEPAEIPARACDCGFCTKHGGVWTSCPAGTLRVTVRDASRVSSYAFATKTARFQVCAECGVVPLVTSRIDGRVYAVVNVNAFENLAELGVNVRRAPASFDGEDEAGRLARRQRNWIGSVVLPSALQP